MTAPNPTGKGLIPFVKGDVRINRNGRPKSFDAWRKLHKEILGELALDKDGHPIIVTTVSIDKDGNETTKEHFATQAEMMIRSDIRDVRRRQAVADTAFGKVPQPVEHTGKDGQPIAMTWAEFIRQPNDDDKPSPNSK